MNEPSTLMESYRQLLCNQQISAAGPGTILADAESLINFIGEAGLVTKSKQGNLPSATLAELNLRLADPLKLELTRPLLKDYPNISGIYVLLRVMGLVRLEGKTLRIDASALATWRGLNPTEQYFTLMWVWLYHAQAEVLGVADHYGTGQLADNLTFLAAFKEGNWKSFMEYCHRGGFFGAVSTWNTQLSMRFGLIEVQSRPVKGRKEGYRGWSMEKGRRTPWGDAVTAAILEVLQTDALSDLWLLGPSENEDSGFGLLVEAFHRFRPELKKTYELQAPVIEAGSYFFRCKIPEDQGRASCLLAVPSEATLHEVASAVLDAFKFWDTEHLYEFRYRDRLGRARVYNHYECDEGPWADEIKVGGMDLPAKSIVHFLFDFGNSCKFELKLEKIAPSGAQSGEIEIVEFVGQPPPQYEGGEGGWV
jgi:hypothetical protein